MLQVGRKLKNWQSRVRSYRFAASFLRGSVALDSSSSLHFDMWEPKADLMCGTVNS